MESDRLSVFMGDLILDGQLNITLLDGATLGTYTLIDYTGNLSDFGLELGTTPTGFEGELITDFSNNRVLLQVNAIPEPGMGLLLGIFGAALLGRRRR